ncbi:hypothetical protein SGGMMB4_02730 [Sodalis glossinidius str. 'morsitans']|uniref:Uncharacterized protein n=1 Tax=Sodalis glossinidius (strain morsitans) TaxID=343509 RepID=A0A193QIT6_SODGM|nr:hypothetical protein SGGMMB4_02629 [Sodalis glossinidius str. 'morsitans']CRL45184.1 hypothetical protein SGGMMB4_02730 [Sodalis glossinidius str. 'morsitans']
MKNAFIVFCMKVSGKTKNKLAKDFGFHYFLMRSKFKAYLACGVFVIR